MPRLPSDTHAVLRPAVELEAREYTVTVLVTDSGDPQLGDCAQVNVTVCPCDSFGDCKSRAGALLGSSVGISIIVLFIIIACAALLIGKCSVLILRRSSFSTV